MISCLKMPSGTVPRATPAATVCPASTTGVNSHFLSVSKAWTYTPGVRKKPSFSATSYRGFWRPS